MQLSYLLASILGPILIALSTSEYLNFKIWENPHPTLVYLNGLILLTGGIIIVRIHNSWSAAWPIIITLIGWLILLAGLFRMFFPTQKQLPKNTLSIIIMTTLFLLGIYLTIKGYSTPSP